MRRISNTLSLGLLTALLLSTSAQASGGTVMSWGGNPYGETGVGVVTENLCICVETPTLVSGVSGATQTSGGFYQSLFLISDGTVKSAGYGEDGALGYPAGERNPTPTTVPGLSGVIAVDAGGDTSYALLANGTVMAWGANSYGQLGVAPEAGPETCPSDPCANHPVQVAGLANVVAISASTESDTAFALLADGTVKAWGQADDGQLGDGTGVHTGCECSPQPVTIPGVAGAIAIAGGYGSGLALLADHSLVAWGESYDGQLGNGNTTDSNPACRCIPATKTLSGVKAIAGGDYHGVALMLDGSTMTWGYNYEGQVGNGTKDEATECDCVATPVAIPAYAGARSASANYYDTSVLFPDGTLRGNGENDYNEIADGSFEPQLSPVDATQVSGVSAVDLRYYGAAAIVGPSQTLSAAFAGAGTGTVQGGGEISCPTVCSAVYPQGKVTPLTATSTGGGFAGFSGPCTGTAICEAKMETDQSVTATFGVPKGTTITKAKFSGKKVKRATFSFSAPGAITGYECLLIRPKPKKRHKAKASKAAKKKKKKPQFTSCTDPKAYKNLKPGSYTFKVRALDILGADALPAKRVFKVKAPRKRRR